MSIAFYAERSLRSGAFGYITRGDAAANILPAIRRVLAGKAVTLAAAI